MERSSTSSADAAAPPGRPLIDLAALTRLLVVVMMAGCSCGGPMTSAYEACGTDGSRFYMEAVVDGVPLSRCVPGSSSWHLGHESPTTPGDPYHRFVDVFPACPPDADCPSEAELASPPLCGGASLYMFNVDLSSPSEGELLPRTPAYFTGGFFDTSVDLLVSVDRPDRAGRGGNPATCANLGDITWSASGHYRVLQGGAAGQPIIIEVSDAVVHDVPAGHSIVIDYVRWEFVLNDLSVAP
jgi:hypothetical protein